jgi:hypothetical protein
MTLRPSIDKLPSDSTNCDGALLRALTHVIHFRPPRPSSYRTATDWTHHFSRNLDLTGASSERTFRNKLLSLTARH